MRRTAGRVSAALAALVMSASATLADVKPVVIGDDVGGNLAFFAMWYKRIRDSGVPVRVEGVCESACTLALSLPHDQVCIAPTASFGFHLASYNGETAPGVTGAMIRRWYPEKVRKWLVGQTLIEAPLYMTANTVVSLGIFPACEDQ
jgi:hypothetical protein